MSGKAVRQHLTYDQGPSCFLCRAARSTPDQLPWYDRPIARSVGGATAVASLGAFVRGYILIVPAAHAFNTRSLEPAAREDLAQFTTAVLAALESQVGEVTVFEHGSCFDDHTRRSACTEHAHLHLVPGQFNLDPELPIAEVHDSFADFLAVGPGDGSPYLMLRNPGGAVRVYPDPGISQYVRRLIAAALGEPDDWDYAVFPRMANVKATTEMVLKVG